MRRRGIGALILREWHGTLSMVVETLTGQDAGGVYGQAGVDYGAVCVYVLGEPAKGSDECGGVGWGYGNPEWDAGESVSIGVYDAG